MDPGNAKLIKFPCIILPPYTKNNIIASNDHFKWAYDSRPCSSQGFIFYLPPISVSLQYCLQVILWKSTLLPNILRNKNGILYTAFQWHWEHYPRKSNIAPTYMYLLAFMFVWIDNTRVVRLSHTAHQCKGSHYETSLNISNSCVGSFCSLQQWFILTTVYMLNTAPFPNPVSLLLFPLLSRTMILCVHSKYIDDSQDNCLPAIKIHDSIKKKPPRRF